MMIVLGARGWAMLAAMLLALLAVLPAAAQTPNPCNNFGVQKLSLTPTLPANFSSGSGQAGANCMAWQSFIALNWKADPNNPGQPDPSAPPAAFGTAGDISPKVWESYFNATAVFAPHAAARLQWAAPRQQVLNLTRLSEFGLADLSLSGISQAGNGKWLTNQRGALTYYQILMNQDEFDFITKNVFAGADLTSYAGQLACATQPGTNGLGGFNLPGGGAVSSLNGDTDCTGKPAVYGKNIGAIEVKAAWTVLPGDHSLDDRYLTARADINLPGGKAMQVTVGLVGLHIIHKVQGAQQFVWATFEQIDNDPDQSGNAQGFTAPVLPQNAAQKPRPGYTYFNPACTPQSDPVYGCVHNQLPGTPCSAQNTPAGCDPYDAPMQITRMVPVDTTSSATTNPTGAAWALLPAGSVFNYYRLIDAQWPSNTVYVAPGAQLPLPSGDITPNHASRIVANTTLETYEQTTNSCTDCHFYTPIAEAKNRALRVELINGLAEREVLLPDLLATNGGYASDYSFIFDTETNH
jgi:hypothetical protein